MLERKVDAGEIDLPRLRIEDSQKAARGVHTGDLAARIDRRAAIAQQDQAALCGPASGVLRRIDRCARAA